MTMRSLGDSLPADIQRRIEELKGRTGMEGDTRPAAIPAKGGKAGNVIYLSESMRAARRSRLPRREVVRILAFRQHGHS